MGVSPEVQNILKEEGISAEELSAMVNRAAITSIRGFNRRFNDWLFVVKSGSILRMATAELMEIGDGREKVCIKHRLCSGKGCKRCGWSGEIIYRH